MAGRCGGGAGRNAGAGGRAIAGGGAGRAMAGGRAIAGGGAGRAIGGGAGRAIGAWGAGLPGSWACAPTLAAITITEAPSRKAAKRPPSGSMVAAPRSSWFARAINARSQESFGRCVFVVATSRRRRHATDYTRRNFPGLFNSRDTRRSAPRRVASPRPILPRPRITPWLTANRRRKDKTGSAGADACSRDDHDWRIASLSCGSEFGCYRCITNSGKLLAGRFMGSRPRFSPLPVTRGKIAYYECRWILPEGRSAAVDTEVPTLLVSSTPWRMPLHSTESFLPVGSPRRWH
jgi:hypothetical protein